MRISVLPLVASLALCGAAHASGQFIPLQTPDMMVSQLSPNGAYAVGYNPFDGGALRWIAATGEEEVISGMNVALGINDAGTISGAVPESGGADNGGRDLGAYAPVGSDPVLLTDTLQTNSNGYGISADGTVVGLSFDDDFSGNAVAFVWSASDGMEALPVNRPANYSRANVISADGQVIAGWNDQDDGSRTAVIWQDRVPLDVVDADGMMVGEADGISANGKYVVGSDYTDVDGNFGSWIWSAEDGLRMIPGMTFAFGVTNDGKTVVGNTGFFDDPPRAAMIWRDGVGVTLFTDYLAEEGIDVPDDWDLGGGLGAISADGTSLGGWGFGPLGTQSYIVQLERDDIFADGFDGTP